jgi:VanZ family protein
MAVIFWFSHQPSNSIADFGAWDLLIKKLAHLLAYAVLALLAYVATGRYSVAWGIAVLYAMSDEFHQTFIPGRNGTAVDVLIDSLGATLALLTLHYLQTKQTQP